ncbi:MAG TPA: hypothetical protein VMU85_17310 [Stellaceae bacterium]|nr:hypothetical protein [Stellaceae bacterium]
MTAVGSVERPGAPLLYRAATPAVVLALWLGICALWVSGHQDAYDHLLRYWGITPFLPPFVDLHDILSAAECHRAGIDVFQSNPCDILNRPMIYSPVWLYLMPAPLAAATTAPGGIVLNLLFIAVLPVMLKPRSLGELLLYCAASISTMVVYALERANADLIIFLLLLAAGWLYRRGGAAHFAAYAAFLLAGVLKFYPIVLMALAVRERWKTFLALAVLSAAIMSAFFLAFAAELRLAISHIPTGDWFTEQFSAQNVPFGLIEVYPGLAAAMPRFPGMLMGALTALSLVIAVFLARGLLQATDSEDWTGPEATYLVMGSVLLAGCFFAGPNVDYRGIYFLFILPGLVELMRRHASLRPLLGLTVAAILFTMWSAWLRKIVSTVFHWHVGDNAEPFPKSMVLFWIGREIVWWWIVSVLVSIALVFVLRSPLARDLLGRSRTRPARR